MLYKLWGIVRRDANGKLLGLVELSFSMGWSKTNICWHDKPITDEYMKKLSSENYKTPFVIRFNSRKCPIEFDWKERAKKIKLDNMKKYDRRNIPFTEKDPLMFKVSQRAYL